METIFCSFDQYPQAHNAVKALLGAGYPEKEMNAIIRMDEAKLNLEQDMEELKVKVTDKLGSIEAKGMARLIGGHQPLELEDIGEIYASGKLAAIAAKTAADPDHGTGNLKDSLVELDVDLPLAKAYRQKIIEKGVLFFIRVQDEETGKAIQLLTENKGKNITMVP
jgi:hypothetical protein